MAMLIGELARRAGVKAQTVRYYETLGLLSPVQRIASGYRSYSARALEELQFIRKAQSLGFSLDDVRQILDVARAGRAPCSRVLAIAEKHLLDLDQRIAFRNFVTTSPSRESLEGWRCTGALRIDPLRIDQRGCRAALTAVGADDLVVAQHIRER